MRRRAVIRLGAVGYLNARPLVYGLERDPRFALQFDVPSRCAEQLHQGATDLGLIPSVEYLRRTSGDAGGDYAVVPGPAVVSRGDVASVALYATRPVADVRSIALDTSSRTSVALTRVLCVRAFGISPELRPHGPDLDAMLAICDAALIIGDNALFLEAEPSVEKIDLGKVWTDLTGLPFVYAFWVGPQGVVDAAGVAALQAARDAGIARLDEIAQSYTAGDPVKAQKAAVYLRDNIRYDLGAEERAGLELFYRYASETGVVGPVQPLRFHPEP